VIFALMAACPAARAAAQAAPAGASRLADQGGRLFLGQARFENGGPPCGSCHQVSTLPFPNGGTVGPDLSGAYTMLGDEGTDVTLQTLFFPTMMPLYEKRPLTAPERQALKALLQQARPAGATTGGTPLVAGIASVGFLLLLVVAWLASRHRLVGVRAPLVSGAVLAADPSAAGTSRVAAESSGAHGKARP
jgi:hypothetical protein